LNPYEIINGLFGRHIQANRHKQELWLKWPITLNVLWFVEQDMLLMGQSIQALLVYNLFITTNNLRVSFLGVVL
jgi:hypothetical protein